MADDTQGKATQRAAGGPSNPGAVDKGEARATRTTERTATRREAPRTPTATAAAPENSVLNPGGKDDNRPTAEQIAKREPRMYRALERGYVDGKIVEPGEVFTTKADKGEWMEKAKASDYGVEAAVEEAGMAKKVDIVYEDLPRAALIVFAAMEGVSKPDDLKDEELIQAIRAARRVDAQ